MKTTVCFITCGIHSHVRESWDALMQHTPETVDIVCFRNNTMLPLQGNRLNLFLFGGISDDFDGIAVARNKCLKYAQGETIIWIDDDIIVCANYLMPFIAAFENNKRAGIVGYDACRLIKQEDFIDLCHVDPFQIPPDYFDSPYAIRRQMLVEIGGYDESLGKYDCDNTDLCLRAHRAKWELQPIINPGIIHWMGSTRDTFKKLDSHGTEWEKTLNQMQIVHGHGWRHQYQLSMKIFQPDPSRQFKPGERRM